MAINGGNSNRKGTETRVTCGGILPILHLYITVPADVACNLKGYRHVWG